MRISDWSSDVCSSDLASRHVVQRERVAGLPRDVVVGARGIAADAERAHPRSLRVVQRKAAAEHVHATDPRAHQRILRRAEVRGSAGVGYLRIDRVGKLQAEQERKSTRLNSSN